MYNKDEKYDDSIHHQTRIWILLETTLSTAADAGAGIVPTITETTLVSDLATYFRPWLNSLTSGFNVNDTGIDTGYADLFTITAPPSITAVGGTNAVTATAINGSGVTVTGVNLADILSADVSIRAVATGVSATGTIVVSGQTATQFTLVNSTIGAGSYYLRVTDVSDSDNQKVISYKRFTIS